MVSAWRVVLHTTTCFSLWALCEEYEPPSFWRSIHVNANCSNWTVKSDKFHLFQGKLWERNLLFFCRRVNIYIRNYETLKISHKPPSRIAWIFKKKQNRKIRIDQQNSKICLWSSVRTKLAEVASLIIKWGSDVGVIGQKQLPPVSRSWIWQDCHRGSLSLMDKLHEAFDHCFSLSLTTRDYLSIWQSDSLS